MSQAWNVKDPKVLDGFDNVCTIVCGATDHFFLNFEVCHHFFELLEDVDAGVPLGETFTADELCL